MLNNSAGLYCSIPADNEAARNLFYVPKRADWHLTQMKLRTLLWWNVTITLRAVKLNVLADNVVHRVARTIENNCYNLNVPETKTGYRLLRFYVWKKYKNWSFFLHLFVYLKEFAIQKVFGRLFFHNIPQN